jgi:formylglycine-generating enzyme required for sulfatase activity
MDRRRAAAITLASVVAIALLTGVIVYAGGRAEPPARCAAGMIAVGPRCCGEGQHLDGERCAGAPSRCAVGMRVTPEGCVAAPRVVRIEGGALRVGPGDWEAQGVVTPYQAEVAPFGLDLVEVTEERWSGCVAAGACPAIRLSGEPGRAVAEVTRDEAARFCAWAGGALPTSDQLAFAAAGRAGRRYAWGDTGAVCRRAAWGLTSGPCAWGAAGPELAGAHPDGASPEGALDLAGNVAEWATAADGTAEVRGGSFADGAAGALRSWQRRAVAPDTRSPQIGFRCAQSAP